MLNKSSLAAWAWQVRCQHQTSITSQKMHQTHDAKHKVHDADAAGLQFVLEDSHKLPAQAFQTCRKTLIKLVLSGYRPATGFVEYHPAGQIYS